jgi:hypothetical protein
MTLGGLRAGDLRRYLIPLAILIAHVDAVTLSQDAELWIRVRIGHQEHRDTIQSLQPEGVRSLLLSETTSPVTR